jgi:hypothetical protein
MLAFLFTEAVHGNPKVPYRVIAVRDMTKFAFATVPSVDQLCLF